MRTDKQKIATNINFTRFYMLGLKTMLRKFKNENLLSKEHLLVIEYIQVCLAVFLCENVSAWNWKTAVGTTMAVGNMTKDHILACINLLGRNMIFSEAKERLLWILIFKAELVKRINN